LKATYERNEDPQRANAKLNKYFEIILTKRFAYVILKNMNPDDLIAWRRRNGYTQIKLAEALGVHPMTVSKWERNVHRKEIPTFLHLALRCLELEGGEKVERDKRKKKTKKERDKNGHDLFKR
jgi:DNA-binding transcriptional regulator YiaG